MAFLCLFDEPALAFLFALLPLMVQIAVVFVNFLILGVMFSYFWFKVIFLHSFVLLLHLLVSDLAYLLFLFLLFELQVERVHHLPPEVIRLLLVLFLGLHADLQVVAGVTIPQPAGPALLNLMDIF